MPVEYRSCNAVAIAEQFNPSVISERWLIRKGVVLEGEFEPGAFYTPVAVRVPTTQFELVAMSNRVQINPRDNAKELAIERFIELINSLPETPYKAVGLNFEWLASVDGESPNDTVKRTFFNEACFLGKVLGNLAVGELEFGGWVRVNLGKSFLHFDAKPGSAIKDDDVPGDKVLIRLNLHHAVEEPSEPVRGIIEFLKSWPECFRITAQISKAFVSQ